MLPAEVKHIILEYHYSYKVYRLKQKVHHEMAADHFFKFLVRFFRAHVAVAIG